MWISDTALGRLREAADQPDLTGTPYEILGTIGRGGMGTVYLARDRDLGREVALKVVEEGPSGDLAERMLREARILARLEHPGIWVGEHKIASIGVHVSRGVTVQGIAMNLDVDPALFGSLVSCGMQGPVVRNAKDFGARPVTLPDAARRWAELFAEDMGVPLEWAPAAVAAAPP